MVKSMLSPVLLVVLKGSNFSIAFLTIFILGLIASRLASWNLKKLQALINALELACQILFTLARVKLKLFLDERSCHRFCSTHPNW